MLLTKVSFSQNPTYTLDVNDGALIAPNIFEFDIDITWTNGGFVSNFEYAGGQFHFDVNGAIANGGILSLDFVSSDLPTNVRSRIRSINTASNPWQLRLLPGTFPGAGNGYQMSAGINTNIVRLKLATTAESFAPVDMQLQWRNGPLNPVSKVFAYVGTTNTDITTISTHSMSLSGFFINVPYNVTAKIGIEGLLKNDEHLRKDTVKIYIRSSETPFLILDSSTSIIDSITLTASMVTIVPTGNYYIVIKHRNSLETWSKPGGEPLGNGNYFYDFTTSASQAYGNNLILKGSTYCIYSGNINGDDIIDAEDLIYVDNDVFNYAPGTNITNLNGDQIVDIEDLAICEKNARALRIVQWPGSAFTLNSRSVRDIFTSNSRIIINP